MPQGEVGELIVAGRNLAAGYVRGRDAHKFLDNPYTIDPGEKITQRNLSIVFRESRGRQTIEIRFLDTILVASE